MQDYSTWGGFSVADAERNDPGGVWQGSILIPLGLQFRAKGGLTLEPEIDIMPGSAFLPVSLGITLGYHF